MSEKLTRFLKQFPKLNGLCSPTCYEDPLNSCLTLSLDIVFGNDLGKVTTNVGDDLNQILNLNPIYFDLDKSFIRPDAEVVLLKVIAVMSKYHNLKVVVFSHTYIRANDTYNIALSGRRNVSTIKYIVEKGGIAQDRLTGKDYSQRQLTNKCRNGEKSSKADLQLN